MILLSQIILLPWEHHQISFHLLLLLPVYLSVPQCITDLSGVTQAFLSLHKQGGKSELLHSQSFLKSVLAEGTLQRAG